MRSYSVKTMPILHTYTSDIKIERKKKLSHPQQGTQVTTNSMLCNEMNISDTKHRDCTAFLILLKFYLSAELKKSFFSIWNMNIDVNQQAAIQWPLSYLQHLNQVTNYKSILQSLFITLPSFIFIWWPAWMNISFFFFF